MQHIYEFHSSMKRTRPIDISDKGTLTNLEKAIKKATIGTSGVMIQSSSGEEEVTSKGYFKART